MHFNTKTLAVSELTAVTYYPWLQYHGLQAIQVHTKAKTPATNRTSLYKKTKEAKSKCYFWTHGRTRRLDNTSTTCNLPKTGHQV